MKYRLLAIDVDGTLLGSDHQPDSETVEAIQLSREQGLRICLATGRSYDETIEIWRKLQLAPPFEPIILVGGALVSEGDTGRTLYQRTIERELACEFADALAEAGYCAMGLVDGWRHGWDYLLCETGDVHTAVREWLDKTGARVRRVGRFAEAGDFSDPLRITVVADPLDAEQLVAEMHERFNGRLEVHAIVAPNYGVTIVEGFAAGVNKWTALNYVAQGYRIAPREIAAIGDDVNDLGMIRSAALGAAMPGAVPLVREAADRVVTDGLATFIRRLTAGELD